MLRRVRFRILGPIEALDEAGEPLRLGGPKQRAVLAMLLLAAGGVVSKDRLIEGLWGERPPASAAHTLDDYLSRLRRLLGEGRLARRPPGYALRVEAGELDFARFEELRRQAREQPPESATATLTSALRLWRGPALADLLNEPFASAESNRLEDGRLAALEDRIDADLALGRAADVVPELEMLVRDQPFRERPVAQLGLALYRVGRQAEALATLAAARRRFADELGLQLGPQLQELERRILSHDPRLAAPARELAATGHVTPPGRRQRVVPVALVAGAATTLVVLGGLVVRGGSSSDGKAPAPSAVVSIDAESARISAGVSVRGAPTALASAGGSLWVADADADTVSHVSLEKGTAVQRIDVPGGPGSLAAGDGSVWVASTAGGTVTRIDIGTETVTQTIPLGVNPAAVAVGSSGVWVADPSDESLIRLDPQTGAATRTVSVPGRPTAIAVDGETVWVASHDAGTLTAVDGREGRVLATVAVGQGPRAVVAGRGSVWVANDIDGTVSRVDEASARVRATISTGGAPVALAIAGGSVWVGDATSDRIGRIDLATDTVSAGPRVAGRATALAALGGEVLVGTGPLARHRGGVLTLLRERPLSVDPALNYDIGPLQSDGLTRDSLVTLNHAGGPAGLQLVPDLAIALPTLSADRRTYTFRLRPGIRYSDGRPLRAGDFRRAIVRLFSLESPAAGFFDGLVDAHACAASRSRCTLARGLTTDDAARTVTFHLRAPDPDFLFKFTVGGFAAPVPAGTPMRPVEDRGIPGTGPYRVLEADRRHVRYGRNAFFREWSHAAQPDGAPNEIVWRFGVPPAKQVDLIEHGRGDWTTDGIPPRVLADIRTRLPAQVHVKPLAETDFFQINTTRPPFDDVRVRRALNLAIDRREVARLYGGTQVATPTCQTLPPGVPGFRRRCPYRRDLAQARALVRASGTAGERVTVWGFTDDPTLTPAVSRHVARTLRRLGFRARLHVVTHRDLERAPPAAFDTIQLIPAGWVPDYPSANAMLGLWFRCDGAYNHGYFCRPGLDRLMDRAAELQTAEPRQAARLWSKVDSRLVAAAAWLPLVNPRATDFLSKRARNYQRHPLWGVLADQLWVR